MPENERVRLRAIAVIQHPLVAELERLAASDADLNALTFRLEGDPSKLAEYLEELAGRVADAKGFRLRFDGSKTPPCKD